MYMTLFEPEWGLPHKILSTPLPLKIKNVIQETVDDLLATVSKFGPIVLLGLLGILFKQHFVQFIP